MAPKKILWQSEQAAIENTERMLIEGRHQVSTVNTDLCLMKNLDGQASILLDFGREIHVEIEFVIGMCEG